MIENHRYRRPGYGREHAFPRGLDQRDRRAQARGVAEALFAPKPPVSEQPAGQSTPRLLRAEAATVTPETLKPVAIPADNVTRIRAWKRYGMTVSQIAEVCGVEIGEIKRLLR